MMPVYISAEIPLLCNHGRGFAGGFTAQKGGFSMKHVRLFLSALLAGVAIGIGGAVFLSV